MRHARSSAPRSPASRALSSAASASSWPLTSTSSTWRKSTAEGLDLETRAVASAYRVEVPATEDSASKRVRRRRSAFSQADEAGERRHRLTGLFPAGTRTKTTRPIAEGLEAKRSATSRSCSRGDFTPSGRPEACRRRALATITERARGSRAGVYEKYVWEKLPERVSPSAPPVPVVVLVEPLSRRLRRSTASAVLRDKIEHARTSDAGLKRDLAALIERAMDELIAVEMKRRSARASRASPRRKLGAGSRHAPVEVESVVRSGLEPAHASSAPMDAAAPKSGSYDLVCPPFPRWRANDSYNLLLLTDEASKIDRQRARDPPRPSTPTPTHCGSNRRPVGPECPRAA